MLLTGESEFFHPAHGPANLNLNLSLEFNSTTDVNVAYEVIIILTNDENKLGKGAENQNGNLRWHLPGRGGGLEGVSFAIKLF